MKIRNITLFLLFFLSSVEASIFIQGPELGDYSCVALADTRDSEDSVELFLDLAKFPYGGRSLLRVAEYEVDSTIYQIQFAPVGLGREGGYYTAGSNTNYFTPYLMTGQEGTELVEFESDDVEWSSYLYFIDKGENVYKNHKLADFRLRLIIQSPTDEENENSTDSSAYRSLGGEEVFCYKN